MLWRTLFLICLTGRGVVVQPLLHLRCGLIGSSTLSESLLSEEAMLI